MTDQVAAFIDGLPKAELHLHLKGTPPGRSAFPARLSR